MKLSLIIATVCAAALAQAAEYTTTFTDVDAADHCVDINEKYLNKVSDTYYVLGDALIIQTDAACDDAILTNVREVCGSTVDQSCI
ncbi:hypothetical protein K501DRAFT_286054 [Backusella circina FSU 941]|nr:hypothetical protein K501DRAFT_286054 [Backusella circina FSU 941]